MNATESVADLFGQLSLPDRGLRWLADELISTATERSVIVFEAVLDDDFNRVLYYLGNPPVRLEYVRVSMFRTLLALFAGIGRKETGADVNPYGDRYSLARESTTGPVRLHIDFTNTPAMQRLQLAREPLTHPHAANGAAAHPTSAEPVAG
jgi:hypothetical protein